MRRLLLARLFALAALLPALAFAGWEDFLPTPVHNRIYLDLWGDGERDDQSWENRRDWWRDVFLREKVSLESEGWCYDPRFLQYEFSLGLGRKQENYTSSATADLGWWDRGTEDYDVRLSFLPEHPYNLFLFASRFEPMTREQAARGRGGSVQTSQGATFRYREKPWFARTDWVRETNTTVAGSSATTRADASGEYFRRFRNGNEVSVTGSAERAEFDGEGGLHGSLDQLHLGNELNFQRLRLGSNIGQIVSDQEGGAAARRFRSDDLLWTEDLGIFLPIDLTGRLFYRFQRTNSRVGASGPQPENEYSVENRNFEAQLTQKVYRSLDVTWLFNHLDYSGSRGGSTSTTNSLTLNYTKEIPNGRLLAGLIGSTSTTDNRGTSSDVAREPHLGIQVPTGSFVLERRDVDAGSIVVLVKSPDPPYETIELAETEHWVSTTNPADGSVEIRVLSLPARFPVPAAYDFYVSYRVTGGDFGLRTITRGGNASVSFFGDRLVPYASWMDTDSDVVSGTFPGSLLDQTIWTAGVRLRSEMARLNAEFDRVRSELNPYDQQRVELQLSKPAGANVSLYGSVLFESRRYFEGTNVVREPYTERRESVFCNLLDKIPWMNMVVSLGGSWAKTQGPVEASSYTGSASVTWKVGLLDLSAGATTSSSSSESTPGAVIRRDHATVYLRLRRQLW